MRTGPQIKGDALETAVRAVESAILREFPGYSEDTFRIETKQVRVVAGVRHEIDLLVTVVHKAGYDSTFIFECKNWAAPIDKNQLIVFSEKIRALDAQRGFFVAPQYTADATAQAALDSRMRLCTAAEIDRSTVEVPGMFHVIELRDWNADVRFVRPTAEPAVRETLDFASATFELQGERLNLDTYLRTWGDTLRNEAANRFNSVSLAGGLHRLNFEGKREFERGTATVDGKPVKRVEMQGSTEIFVGRAIVVSAFEIGGRGRTIQVEATAPSGTVGIIFVQTLATDSPST